MKKIPPKQWPEIVFASSDSQQSRDILRAIKAGQLIKIATKLYVNN